MSVSSHGYKLSLPLADYPSSTYFGKPTGTRFLSTHPHMARASSPGTPRFVIVKFWILESKLGQGRSVRELGFQPLETSPQHFNLIWDWLQQLLSQYFLHNKRIIVKRQQLTSYLVALRLLADYKTNPLSFRYLMFWSTYTGGT